MHLFLLLLAIALALPVGGDNVVEASRREPLPTLELCVEYTSCREDRLSTEEHCEYLETVEGRPRRRIEFVAIKNERVVEDSSVCGVALHPQYALLRKHVGRYEKEIRECMAEALVLDSDSPFSREGYVYCVDALSESLPSLIHLNSSSDCWDTARRKQRRCSDLRRCCQPAMECEQKARRSHNGQIIESLKEEIGIKLADCRSMRGGERREIFRQLYRIRGKKKTKFPKIDESKQLKKMKVMPIEKAQEVKEVVGPSNDEAVAGPTEEKRREERLPTRHEFGGSLNTAARREQKRNTTSIHIDPRAAKDFVALCSPYIDCVSDHFHFQQKCTAAQGVVRGGERYDFILAYGEVAPVDEVDDACRRKHADDLIIRALEDHAIIGQYLKDCARTVESDWKKEGRATPSTCLPSVLSSPRPPLILSASSLNSTCRVEQAARKSRCLLLRGCCPAAEFCESSSFYASLTDSLMASVAQLRATMNGCYHGKKNEDN